MRTILLACGLALTLVTQPTIWGGDHVELETKADGARLEFDCAHGDIREQVRPDAQGRFSVKGTFTPERSGPGPTRDDGPQPLEATYAGVVKEDVMSLRVTVKGQETVQSYELTRGQRGNVRKCR